MMYISETLVLIVTRSGDNGTIQEILIKVPQGLNDKFSALRNP